MDKFKHEVSITLHRLRIPVHFQGFEMIKTAACILKDKPEAIHKAMKLYTAVGEQHNASPAKVERCIRSALHNADSDFVVQKEVLGTNRELTNSEFLATLVEVVKLRLAGVE